MFTLVTRVISVLIPKANLSALSKEFTLRGYCTPGQFLDCFCIFLINYNTLVTSKICFL